MQRGSTAAAYLLARHVYQRAPGSLGVIVLFASNASAAGRPGSAATAFAKAARLDPRNVAIAVSEEAARFARRALQLSAQQIEAMSCWQGSPARQTPRTAARHGRLG